VVKEAFPLGREFKQAFVLYFLGLVIRGLPYAFVKVVGKGFVVAEINVIFASAFGREGGQLVPGERGRRGLDFPGAKQLK